MTRRLLVAAFALSALVFALFMSGSHAQQLLGQTVPVNISTAATTQIVPAATARSVYVLHWDVIAGGTGNFTWVYGTGTNCGTGQQSLTGAYPLASQAGLSPGDGTGAVLIVPAGNALCATTSAAVQYSGSVTYILR